MAADGGEDQAPAGQDSEQAPAAPVASPAADERPRTPEGIEAEYFASAEWQILRHADGRVVPTLPAVPVDRTLTQQEWEDALTMDQGDLAVAVLDEKLHLLYRRGVDDHRLWHAVFDGTAWSEPIALEEQTTGDGAALAAFDGKLHAVYPAAGTQRLVHTVLEDGEWSKAQPIDGHESVQAPALLALPAMPNSAAALLLVHAGHTPAE
ncbi:hypothetical protein OG432_00170 [Streptomyces sp. NBC_00442]|uniref:hypothetical protein n=1 Tax=Streptomyces sp. NBC_00442 TaxID=2903651 RepID=UPI002E1F9657